MNASAAVATPPRTEGAVGRFLDEHQRVSGRLPGRELSWLADLRRAAVARFAEVGLPSPRDEAWKYTRVTPIEKRALKALPEAGPAPDLADIEPLLFPELDCRRLVFVNGRYDPRLSAPGEQDDRLRVAGLAETLENAPEVLEGYLARYADADVDGFAALNLAFVADGAVIRLPRDQVMATPIHLLYLNTDGAADSAMHTRNVIVAADDTRARVIESHVGLTDAPYLANHTTEVVLGNNAELEHYLIQQQGLTSFHIGALSAHQARGSRFTSHAVAFGARLSRGDIRANLAGEGAECTLNGLFMVGGRQHVDFHTAVDHTLPHGTSREFYKGILDGRSHGVFNGRVHVYPDAQKTDSEQHNQNLLLSRDAEVDTKPELEIYADDVKCSHGATVGQLDEDMLFYLRARGIGKQAARGLLTYGFAQDVIERMSLAPVRERLEQVLVSRVPDAEHVQGLV